MAEVRFFYHNEETHRTNPVIQTGRRLYAHTTWMAAGGWQMLGDMPRGKDIQHRLQNMAWHMQDALWGVQEQIEVVSERVHQHAMRRQQNRAYEKLRLIGLTGISLAELVFVLQRREYATVPAEIRDDFLRDFALKKLYQGAQGEERFFAESILAQSPHARG